MPVAIMMPALSPTMTEGNLATWCKKEGDTVKPGDILAEIETDKATMEVEAVEAGTLAKIVVPAGTEGVPVNALIAVLLEAGETPADAEAFLAAQGGSPTRPQDAAQASPVATEAAPAATDTDTPPLPAASDTDATRIKASPLAKRIAAQKGIPLHTLHGTGPHGRILKADVLEAQATPQKPVSSTSVARAQPSPMPTGGTTAIPHTTMRKVIARRLSESKQTVPHFYLSVHCAMDALLALRTELNTLSPDDPKAPSYYRLSVNDMLIRASALALRHVPEANASWTDEAIVQYHDVDIAVAVAIPGGLITPIIRHADTKSLPTLSREMKALAERARQNKLLPEEFQGGSFSLSNLGMHGIAQFQAIVNPPQSCILAIGATEGCVVPDTNNQPRCIQRMTATLSCDHRVVDGAVGAAFLQAFRQSVEQPLRLCL